MSEIMGGIRETPAPSDQLIEDAARRIAWVHFMRRAYYGCGSKEEHVRFMVEQHWKNHVEHAEAVFAVIAPFRERAEIAEAMLEKMNAPDHLLPWDVLKARRERQAEARTLADATNKNPTTEGTAA